VAQPRSLRWTASTRRRRPRATPSSCAGADVLVVAAYGLILPPWTLDLPRRMAA
jgi:methionyl-tRNA formyltransferase